MWIFPNSSPLRQNEATHIQGLQAVPAEGVFAVLAHHLGAALVSLDVDFTLGAALDGGVVLFVLVERAGNQQEPSYITSNSLLK